MLEDDPALSIPKIIISDDTLKRSGLTLEEIQQLSKADREQIAEMVYYHYLNDVIWDDIAYIAWMLLDRKS